ncbi:MAG: MFS transporter, partial [Lachnospiraceae bacterium]|nr:MFS transporter [Lachnospiraceae bacterium]
MKLKTGQTIRVGFAFLSICAFWQMYNSIIPLILTNTFAMNETISGAIMAADNVLAIFLLPLFGGISDRCKSKMGRRKPFLLYGTLVSVVLMLLLPILDNRYAAAPSAGTKVLFIVVLGCILVSMGTYRSPSVALMPDVTPKPLRSKANAIINLMGAIGGILYLAIATVLYSEKRTAGLDHVNYLPLFMIVAGIMIVGMLIVLITVDEVGLNRQMAEYEAAHPEEQDTVVDASGEEKLPPEVKRSLGLLLASIALWFISYNAMETWFTTYANRMWGMSLGSASLCLTIATLGAILSYIPVGAIASNIGRKKTILSGVVLMTACFVICFVYTLASDHFSPILYVIFAFVGMGWAAINVNSLPMVVEMCKGSDIGRFTGYYYTFSMAAQIVTPIVAGTLMNRVGYTTLFPYAAVFMAAAF